MKVVEKIDMLKYEKELHALGYHHICGCDEAGRGPLAGPVVAASVILPENYFLEGLTDSKKLSEKKRESFFTKIKEDAISYGIAVIEPQVIDEVNIYAASRLAMQQAIEKMPIKPDYVITDAMPMPEYVYPVKPIVHGDGLSITIAAASILAKVTRDHIMYEMDKEYPQYEFAKHKGYPTKRHIELLKQYGPMKEYRFTYKPVHDLIENGGTNEVKNK